MEVGECAAMSDQNGDKKPELRFYKKIHEAKQRVQLFLESGVLITGYITWRDDYSVGFVPTHGGGSVSQLGMNKGEESLIMKGFIRVVTPVG